ncbi:solute carrier family 45 member 4-like [Anopheles aquasalis]|uniref:solute carrier family 45 member 4-like n=1 Tax=Anopheles aquasalis TaxID=42839 RepID=UPI00215B7489|nr:solute carrier family 45 member 4-like [Anopheles aquasalis]
MAFIAPILFSLGLSYSVMSMIWALPPTVGMLFIPVIGSVSDRCRLSWGRRRPVLLALGIAVLMAMMLIPCGGLIAQTLGLDHLVFMVTLIALGITVTDSGVGAATALCQTYALEVCAIPDHARVLNMMIFLKGVGTILGSSIGAIDWNALPLGIGSVNNETIVFLTTWIVFVVCLVSTLTSYREIPLPVMEKDAMLRPVTHHEIDIHLNRQQQVDCPLIPIEETVSEQLQCRQLIHSIIHMPLAMKKVYITAMLSSMSNMIFQLFLSDFVATKVFHGDVKAPKESEEFQMYEAGVRYRCMGMMLQATSVALFSLVSKRLMDRFGIRRMSSITNPIPYLLLSHYHSKNALILGLVLGSIVDAVGTCTVTLFIAGGCAFLAAISASTIMYLDL